MNKILITGRTTKEIELKQTSTGTSVVEFSVAVRRNFKNANGENESDFFNCVAYSKLAETIGRYVKKGDMIGLDGRLQTRSYTNREGKKVYVTEIIAENVEFLQTKKQEGQKPSFEDDDPFKGANLVEVSDDEGLPF